MTARGLPQSGNGDDRPDEPRTPADQVNTLVDVYSKHERRIYRYCLALLRNPDDAEDATQETFTRAAPFLPNLAGDLSAYLTTVARNICCDVVRARAKRPFPLDNVSLADRAVSPERQSVDWDVVRRMWRQLSPSERLLFAYTFAGYRYEEIATRTGMSRPSVSVGLTRARRRLRELATAIGALGGLPFGVRKLLDRLARRVNAATVAGQQMLVSLVEQASTVAAGLLAGLFSLGVVGGSATTAPPMLATAHHSPSVALGSTQTAVAELPAGSTAVATTPPGRRAAPPPPGASPEPPVVAQVSSLLPGAQSTPQDISPNSVTTSPSFGSDGIAFLSGEKIGDASCVPTQPCPALFRSDDAGGTWTRIWQTSFPGGNILLSPRFPADPTLFLIDPEIGLESGTASDAAPSMLIPTATIAAVDPDSTVGHARLAAITRSNALLTETVGDQAPLGGPALPAGVTPNAMVFTSAGRVLVAGTENTLALAEQAVVIGCNLSAPTCDAPVPVPAEAGVSLAAGPAGSGQVLAYSRDGVYLSTDGGASFRRVATAPSDRLVAQAAIGPTPQGTRLLITYSDAASQRRVWASYSDDLGGTYTDATGNLSGDSSPMVTEVLGGGSLLVGLMPGHTNIALEESTGDGRWAAASSF